MELRIYLLRSGHLSSLRGMDESLPELKLSLGQLLFEAIQKVLHSRQRDSFLADSKAQGQRFAKPADGYCETRRIVYRSD